MMMSLPHSYNISSVATMFVSSTTPLAPYKPDLKLFVTRGNLPIPKPTVSLDARPIVIPILSCVICFPVLAFAVICALRYRAQRLRRRDQLRRIQSGCRSVTLEIPAREKSSFYSKDSSSDPSLKGLGERSEAVPDSPPPLPLPGSRRMSKNNSHVKFMTTTAVLHGRTVTGINGRFNATGKSQNSFWDEHSHIECAQELERELTLALTR